MTRQFVLSSIFILFFIPPSFANNQAELQLFKRDPFLLGPCEPCTDLFSVAENKNLKDLTTYNLHSQTGFYYMHLLGKAGTTVTIFGQDNHEKNQGYLIVYKKDDSPVIIEDIDQFAPKQWTFNKGLKGYSGDYLAWYEPYPSFKHHVSSVQWGKWYNSILPAPPQ